MSEASYFPHLKLVVQYLDNQILDSKGGVNTHEKINRNLLAGNLFRTFLRRNFVSEKTPGLSAAEKSRLTACLDDMFESVDVGQCLEKRYGRYEDFISKLPEEEKIKVGYLEDEIPYAMLDEIWQEIRKDGMPRPHERFVRLYLKRVYLCNASLFVLSAKLVMDLLGYHGQERQNILAFAAHYGMVIQFVNDNNDYLPEPTVEKIAEDVFSDIKNETMALPLIYYFQVMKQNYRMMVYIQELKTQYLYMQVDMGCLK